MTDASSAMASLASPATHASHSSLAAVNDPGPSHAALGQVLGERPGCRLISGRFAALVQFSLMVAALSALVLKRRLEFPRRDFKVWLLDSGKQCIGGLWIHFANLGVSVLFAHVLGHQHGVDSQNECAFYFFNFFVDVTAGLVIVWFLLQVIERAAHRLDWTRLQNSGEYGDPPQMHIWLVQTGCFVLVLTLSKVLVASFLFENRVHLARLGDWLFEPLEQHPKLELVLVMVVGPGLMNAFQFWIQDTFLQSHGGVGGSGGGVGGVGGSKAHISPRVRHSDGAYNAAESVPLGADIELSSNIGGSAKYKYSDDWSGGAQDVGPIQNRAGGAASPGLHIEL